MAGDLRPRYRWYQLDASAGAAALALSPVLDEALAPTVTRPGALPLVLVRTQFPHVLLGPRDRRLPRLGEALAWLRRQGYPAYFRAGSGSAVLLDEGCVSFAVARPARDLTRWQANFTELVEGVVAGLAELGIRARFGAAPGAYCEGPYDLVVDGRKLAGIAQAVRQGFTLVSGMVLVDQDPARTTALLQEFYERAGDGRRLDAGAVTHLKALRPERPPAPAEVAAALYRGYATGFALEPVPWQEADWDRARRLLAAREAEVSAMAGDQVARPE
ncbi:MAG: lipoate--protein ligase family protein [Firmicutes bacterium]|nr:lipoate--protein ligase family protein [Bacillota bacterium]